MKRFTQVALVLSIIMMLASPSEVWGQNRRTSSSSERKTTQSSNSSTSRSSSSSSGSRSSGSQSRTTSGSRSGSSQSRTTSGSSQRQTGVKASSDNTFDFKVDPNYKSPSGSSGSQTTTRRRTTTTSERQVQDYRGNTGSSSTSGSRSSTVTTRRSSSSSSVVTGSDNAATRRSSGSSRQAVTTDRNRSASSSGTSRPSVSTSTRRNATSVNSTVPRRSNDRVNAPAVDRKPAAVQYHNSVPPPRDKNWVRPYIKKHHKPVPPHRFGHHYFGYRINYLPHRAVLRVHNHINYYYYDGIYYRPYFGGGYVICRPPIGTYISSTLLDVALTVAVINALNNAVERANRAVALAESYSRINTAYTVRGVDSYVTNVANQNDEYYYQDGVFYTLSNGQYYVIEPPIGALVTQLPEDYVEVKIGDETYYQVEDALYKVTVIDGALYFEVVLAL